MTSQKFDETILLRLSKEPVNYLYLLYNNDNEIFYRTSRDFYYSNTC
jgi:hypothetical protein